MEITVIGFGGFEEESAGGVDEPDRLDRK